MNDEVPGYPSLGEEEDSVPSRVVGVSVITVDVTNEQEWSLQDVMVITVVESLYLVEETSVLLLDGAGVTRVGVVLLASRLYGTESVDVVNSKDEESVDVVDSKDEAPFGDGRLVDATVTGKLDESDEYSFVVNRGIPDDTEFKGRGILPVTVG